MSFIEPDYFSSIIRMRSSSHESHINRREIENSLPSGSRGNYLSSRIWQWNVPHKSLDITSKEQLRSNFRCHIYFLGNENYCTIASYCQYSIHLGRHSWMKPACRRRAPSVPPPRTAPTLPFLMWQRKLLHDCFLLPVLKNF